MPARSVVLTLQPGIAQAILPDHRKMLPGVEYVVDWDTFEKLSPNARQSVVKVVSVQGDVAPFNGSTTSGTISYPAQWQNSGSWSTPYTNTTIWNVLNTPIGDGSYPPSVTMPQIAGFAAQGVDGNGLIGITDNDQFYGSSQGLKSLTGPAGERYLLVYIAYGSFAGGVMTWWDEENGTCSHSTSENTLGENQYVIIQDGQGTEFQKPTQDIPSRPPFSGGYNDPDGHSGLVGGFAGIATTTFEYGSGWYGWIQTEGFCPKVKVSNGDIKAGDALAVDFNFCVGAARAQGPDTKSVTPQGVVTGTALANNVFGTALTDAALDENDDWCVQADIRSARPKKPYNRFLNKN